jgi:hypothetical protein
MAAAGVVAGAADYGRLQAAARRLERLAQRSHWLVNALNYLAVAPGAGDTPGGLFVAAVVAGRCIGMWTVGSEEAVDELVGDVRRTWRGQSLPREELPTADASTILAVWLQEADASGVEFLIALEEGNEASLHAGRQRLLARLGEKPGNGTRALPDARGQVR